MTPSVLLLVAVAAAAPHLDAPRAVRHSVWDGGIPWRRRPGGGGTTGFPSDLPRPTPSYNTIVGKPTRAVSSWYVGDGPTLFNSATGGEFGPLMTLDSVAQSSLRRGTRERASACGPNAVCGKRWASKSAWT